MLKFAFRSSLLAALISLAACGGDSDSNGPILSPVAAGVPAPCSKAFDDAQGVADNGSVVALSSCTFDAQRNVTIGGDGGCGPRVVVDRSFTNENALGKITIAPGGKLAVPYIIPGGTLKVETAGVLVNGLLSVGASSCAVGGAADLQGRVNFAFTGAQIPSNPATDSGSDKGIEVRSGGILRLFGAKGVGPQGVNWTQLGQPAGPAKYQTADTGILAPVKGNASQLYLAADVSKGGAAAWRTGDWVVVATTSFSPFESEFVQIAEIEAAGSGSLLTLAQPLRHYHFGGADPGLPSDANYGADATTNYGVDERAEVGLISRSISFTARVDANPTTDPSDQSAHWGGEIRILAGFAEASIQGVELEKFGKARLGSYPIHFHMTGPAGPHLVDSNSIHHSYNKCVTLHMSTGVSVTNNVCARAVGHLYYQEIAEEHGSRFIGNLGVGAMSHNFGLAANVPKTDDSFTGGTDAPLAKNFWEGDNLGREIRYDSLNVPNTDNQLNPMRGSCYKADVDGSGTFASAVPCNEAGTFYVEQSSGFWIGNPGTVLEGNSIAGCQGTGKAFWYVPPDDGPARYERLGSFLNNRAHGCFDGLFGEEELPVKSGQMFPTVDSKVNSQNVISHFKGFTATRMRNRGLWVRPMWNAVETGRFATNRESVTLVSSGGPDGNGPGVWSLLKDSVVVGLSTNNVDRWGPCPPASADGFGCVDKNAASNEIMDKGYPSPRWNFAGYMIYDGPVRVIRNHFVNFQKDISSRLTKDDLAVLKRFTWAGQTNFPNLPAYSSYEGDAALGWFQSNQSAYPTATVVKALSFDNVDLRHQIYTERVNLNAFKDGDKNTAVIDIDGSLTGYQVVDANGVKVPDEYPISLNNLPFNRTGNAVDECLATGQQDAEYENRATSLISPGNMASLEFEAQYPRPASWQDMIFKKDSPDGGRQQEMVLQSRNGLSVWEPKVASGTGYTVRTAPSSDPDPLHRNLPTGMPATVRVGLTDAVKSDMDKKPFHVRVGICYSKAGGGALAPENFTITRGYKSWGGNGVNYNDLTLRRSFNRLSNLYDGQNCFNLDHQNPALNNAPGGKGCPAEGVILRPPEGCGALMAARDLANVEVCISPRQTLKKATSITELAKPDGTPATNLDGTPAFDKYYFDAASGMLYFYVVQDSPNAKGAAPVGSCKGQPDDDPACPGAGELDTYFPCPAQGCINYSVEVNDPTYTPGPSACNTDAFAWPEPVITNRLGYAGKNGAAPVQADQATATSQHGETFLHWVPRQAPSCPVSTPPAALIKVAEAGAARKLPTIQVAQWLRENIAAAGLSSDPAPAKGRATLGGWVEEWFSKRQPARAEIDPMAQICTATAT